MNVSTQTKKAKAYLVDQIPTWGALRLVGKSRIASLTILVPFIGYLILFNQELVSYFELSKAALNISSDNGEVSISRLQYLYLGLNFIGFGSIVFAFSCPSLIKNSGTEYDFNEQEMAIVTRNRLVELMSPFKSISEPYKFLEKEFDRYFHAYNNALKEPITLEGGRAAIEKRTAEIENVSAKTFLGLVWKYSLIYGLGWRVIVTALYFVGFTLVLIPSGLVFVKVVGLVIS